MHRIGIVLALIASTTPALAQGDQKTPPPEPGVVYPEVMEHIFDGEEVDGRTRSPDVATTTAHLSGRFTSLIRIRADFRTELLQSANDL